MALALTLDSRWPLCVEMSFWPGKSPTTCMRARSRRRVQVCFGLFKGSDRFCVRVEAGKPATKEGTEQEQYGKALRALALLCDGNAGAGMGSEVDLRAREEGEQLGWQGVHRYRLGCSEVHDLRRMLQSAAYFGQWGVGADQAVVQVCQLCFQLSRARHPEGRARPRRSARIGPSMRSVSMRRAKPRDRRSAQTLGGC